MGVGDVSRVDPDQPRIACLGIVGPGNIVDRVAETSQVDDIRVGRIDRQCEIQITLVQQRDRVSSAESTSLVGMAWLKLATGGRVAILTWVQF